MSGQSEGFSIVVAVAENGKNGTLPWRLPMDMQYFKMLTMSVRDPLKRNAVIMGRKTWQSIPEKFRPLANRLNVVLSRSADKRAISDSPEVLVAGSLEEALALLKREKSVESIFVLGGASVYAQALSSPLCHRLYLTRIHSAVEGDVCFPPWDESLYFLEKSTESFEENSLKFSFQVFSRKNAAISLLDYSSNQQHEEYQYINLVHDILTNGIPKGDRTGVGTLSRFGVMMKFNLRNTFPLLTTKRVFWRGVVEELLWFIAGCTNAKVLNDKGVKIWNDNSTRQFLDSVGLTHYEEGDLGPIYGFQWRHFGAAYKNMHADYTGQGVDQLAAVIETLKKNPNDRRIIMTAWNPADLKKMALPPCHMFCQFCVAKGELSCLMYQRSADVGLGVPFNIASYALLTRMVAHVTDLNPGDFIHVLGDTHIYNNHVEPLRRQIQNVPRPFPKLRINPAVKSIDGFKFSDFELIGYDPHPPIKMDMAV